MAGAMALRLMMQVGMKRLPTALVTALLSLPVATPARAEPLLDLGQDPLSDRLADGDLDEEDLVAMRIGATTGSSDLHGGTWLSLAGFAKRLQSGKDDLGVVLVVGVAFDRIAAGPTHHLADSPHPALPGATSASPPPPTPSPPASPPSTTRVEAIAPLLARSCVAAALRTSGLGVDDAKLDALVERARSSAWLPETRMRAMRLWTDADHTTTVASTDTASLYEAVGANLMLELRLTWRFDRLLYAGDEPTLERVRLERQDARSRLATRVLEVLFAWERAQVAAAGAAAGSPEQVEARLRVAEAQATLDVLTGGWFSRRSEG